MSQFTNLTDINDVRNGLLLYKPVEWAFDRAKLCVEVDSEGRMTFRLLDPMLADISLVDKACTLRKDAGRGNEPLEREQTLRVTFGMLNGQPLKFPDGVEARPSTRLLRLHATVATLAARRQNPHLEIPDMKFDTSGDETTFRAINALRISEWQSSMADVEDFLGVSLHHQRSDMVS